MAPKDFVNIDWNYFYSHLIKMNNDHEEEDDEIKLTVIQRVSSIDSLEENLRFISGYHKWMNTNKQIHVDKSIINNHCHYQEQKDLLINSNDDDYSSLSTNKFFHEEENHMDISLNRSDVQLQINNGDDVFSSEYEKIYLFKSNPCSQTPEMDMESNDHHTGTTNGYSNHRNNDESYKKNSDSSNNNNNENSPNPNRNNNNSRRSSDGDEGDEGDDNDEYDDDDDDDDDESDETIARRLGFLPLSTETINIINRVRHLTNKNSFDRRDFETLQSLIDQLIHLQRLENYSKDQLKQIIHYFKLYRPLQTKSRALIFLQERIPRRAVKYNVISSNHDNNSNVFNIWRERERRARLDSKDSLEDDGQNLSGQQLRDVVEINHPTPPIVLSMASSNSNGTTKVKQMAKDIDIRSVSTRSELNLHTGDHAYIPRSSSPTYPGLVSVALYDVKSTNNHNGLYYENILGDHSRNKQNINPSSSVSPTVSEPSYVQKMIKTINSKSSSSSDMKKDEKISQKKSVNGDHSDGSTSLTSTSPPYKRRARRDSIEKISVKLNREENKYEHNRKEIVSGGRRTVSGTSIEEFVFNLQPKTETSVSMVRDVRARIYEDDTSISRTDVDNIPVKVDVETLYILEEKSDKKSFSPTFNFSITDYEYNRPKEQQDFSVQTTIPTSPIKPPHRPIGTQVNSVVEQQTVGAQTTASLHRPTRERQRLPTPPSPSTSQTEEIEKIKTTTITTRVEIKRRHSSHHTSEDEEDGGGGAVVYIDDKSKKSDCDDNFELKREKRHSSTDERLPVVREQPFSFGNVASRIRIKQLCDINRQVVSRHVQENYSNDDEHRSSEVYEIHTRGACKCLVISYEEKTQYGSETRFEKQLQRIERTYTDEELKSTELHVIVTSSDGDYQLVRRDYGLNKSNDYDKENESKRQPTVSIHYYTKEGHRMRTEQARHLEHLPLVIRSEIEYELNHYGKAQLMILSVTNSERRQLNISLKKELVDEIVARSSGRLSANSPELEQEITRQLSEPTTLLRLVDYSSRDDYNQTNSTDLRRVSRIDVTTSLRLVQRYRTIIHRLCQSYRSHLHLTQQAEQQRYLILVAQDEYYLLDLTSKTPVLPTNISDIRQRQHDIFKREVNNVIQQPFDFVKYRRDAEEQQRILEQRFKQRQTEEKQQQQQQIRKNPPPPGHPSEAEFYLGSGRRALIEREIHSMRESIRPHEHAPPRYKHEPARRSLSISYSGAQRYVRARIIHVKDFYDETHQHEHKHQRQAKEQELFVRVDDFINESAANSLRRSYSTDYLQEDGPRSRIRYIRIPGETVKIEEKTTYEYKGIVYTNLPYSLRYWNILSILDREARQGRPLGSSLPQTIVNDPYGAVIPPLTQQEIRQTAQQILSSQYHGKTYTDQTLRWFLSRDNRTEIESAKYLQTLDQYRVEKEHQQQRQSHLNIHTAAQQATPDKYYVTETLVRYEKMPDRLVPLTNNNRVQSKEILSQRSPSIPRILHPPNLPLNHIPRSKSQPRPSYQSGHTPFYQTPQQRAQLPPMHSPLSRHQSVHELHATSAFSHPPSPSPSLHSLHANHQQHNRRPVAFNNRFPLPTTTTTQNPLLTEIIDSQTGQRILTTSQEQLPTEVLGLLNKYNLRQF